MPDTDTNMNKQLPKLRTNIGTWAVPIAQIPAVTEVMLDNLPPEDYHPTFQGQELIADHKAATTARALYEARRRIKEWKGASPC